MCSLFHSPANLDRRSVFLILQSNFHRVRTPGDTGRIDSRDADRYRWNGSTGPRGPVRTGPKLVDHVRGPDIIKIGKNGTEGRIWHVWLNFAQEALPEISQNWCYHCTGTQSRPINKRLGREGFFSGKCFAKPSNPTVLATSCFEGIWLMASGI